MLKFEILDANGNVSKSFETEKTVIKVGKLQTNDLVINDISVAPIHAQITVLNGSSLKLKDRGMGNGSYINDQQVTKGSEQECSVNDMLRFGKINVRILSTSGQSAPEDEEEGGATITASAADVAKLAAQTSPQDATPPAAQPAIPSAAVPDDESAATVAIAAPAAVQTAPAAPAAPAASEAPAAPAAAKSAFASKAPAAKAPAFGGFNTSAAPQKQIIRKKRPVSFERRFLSEKSPDGNGSLEVAMLWRDEVQSVRTYKSKPGNRVRIGSRNVGKDRVDFGIEDPRLGGETVLLVYDKNQWFLHIPENYTGFLVVDPQQFGKEKMDLKECTGSFGPASLNGKTLPDRIAVPIDGKTRAKLTFCNNNDVSILIHLARPNTITLPILGNVNKSMIGSFVASFLLHFALFSVIIFATDRVDALMIDRILTTSRFAEALIQPEEEQKVEEEEKQDEQEPEEVVEDDTNTNVDAEPTPFAATVSSSGESSGSGMSRSEAIGVAQATGLLAQSQAMNSMLAVGANLDNMDLDWSSFDANVAAQSDGYGIGMTGSGGGGAAMGGFGAGGFGPGGRGGGGAVGAAARAHTGNLGEKGQATVTMKALNPDVSGALDKRVIQKVVRNHFGELRACYERELAKVKGLTGKVQVTWLVSADGNVANAFVSETTLKNKTVETCITNAIKRWRFPKPAGGAACKVTYPFALESGGSN